MTLIVSSLLEQLIGKVYIAPSQVGILAIFMVQVSLQPADRDLFAFDTCR